MAGELGPLGIRVNIVVPGFINTRMNAHIVADPALMEEAEQMIPLRRIGEPAEVAGLIAWLCSDEASYATRRLLRCRWRANVHLDRANSRVSPACPSRSAGLSFKARRPARYGRDREGTPATRQ